MKNSLAIVIAYFGELPEYNNLFIESCTNQNFDLLFFTDQYLSEQENIKIINMKFEQFVELIQKKFDFQIQLDKPYKFVDFQPAIGYIFEDYLKDYDFWGHCDNDQIMGNFSKYITDDLLNKYDKLYRCGHLTIYRNSYGNNRVFLREGGMSYMEAFTKKYNCVFDEMNGIQKKYELLNIPTYQKNNYFDLSFKHYQLKRVYKGIDLKSINSENQLFYVENGCVYRAFINKEGEVEVEEGLYLHFQKRNPRIEISDRKKGYFILPDSIQTKSYSGIPTKSDIIENSKNRCSKEIFSWLNFQKFIWKRRVKKYVLGK